MAKQKGGNVLVSETEAKYRFQSLIIITFSIIGALAFGTFGFLHVTQNNDITAIVELGVGLFILLNLITFRIVDKIEPFATIILALLTGGLIYLVLNGGIENTGFIWIYTLPVVSLGVKGRRVGKFWVGSILIFILILMVLSFTGAYESTYNWVEYRQIAASFLVVSILAYTTIGYLEQRELIFIEQDKKLVKLNSKLEETVRKVKVEQARTESFLNSIGDAVVVADTESKIVYANKSAIAKSGEALRVLKRKTVSEVFKLYKKSRRIPKSQYPCYRVLQQEEFTSIVEPFTNGLYLKDNNIDVPVTITTSPVLVGDEIVGTISICHDATEEARVDREKTEFISIASHQLRTPLTNLSWTLDLFGDEVKLKKEHKELLENAEISVNIMKTLVRDLLNVSRIEQGRLKIEKEDIEVTSVMEQQIKQLDSQETEKGCIFNFKKPKQAIKAHNDPKLVAQILEVFLSNAVRYSKEDQCTITVNLKNKKDSFIMSVKDTGIGIEKDAQKKLFTKYFRAQKAQDFAPQGSGIGLYYAQIIAKALKGKIWFESTPGKGSEFFVEIPKK